MSANAQSGQALRRRLDELIRKQLLTAEAELEPARAAESPDVAPAAPVEIIVPIHNGFEAVQRCLDALRSHTDHRHVITLIDDASTDERIMPLLLDAARADPRLRIRGNPVNQGYLATVNAALSAGDLDVVLLNSDAEVTPGWLDRLARAANADGVGIACPVTDEAGALGVVSADSAPIPDSSTLLRRLRDAAGPEYPRLPVAVGFCMYLRRTMLDEIGVFDPAFAPGYGEENELSMRAWHAGYAVVACPDVLVRHVGGVSFGRGDEVRRRQAVHVRLLNARWPGHDERIRNWWRDWPLRPQALRLSVDDIDPRPRVLHVMDRIDRLGGTEIHTVAIAQALSPWVRSSLIAQERLPGHWADQTHERVGDVELIRCNRAYLRPNQTLYAIGADLSDPGVERRFLRLLEAGRWPLVHIHSQLSWNTLLLPLLARRVGAQVVLSLHSLEALCADFTLVPPGLGHSCGKRFAGIDPDCERCLESRLSRRRGAPLTPLPTYLMARRHFWQRALDQIDLLIAPSRFVLERVAAAFDGDLQRRTIVIPHGLPAAVAPAATIRRPDTKQALTVGFLGGCSVAKGIALVARLADEPSLANLRFRVHGLIDRSVLPTTLPANLALCGPFTPVQRQQVLSELDLVLLPSQIEETFSLVLSECRAAGLPVVASRIGALAERIEDGVDGWLLPPGDVAAWRRFLEGLSSAEGRARLSAIRERLRAMAQRSIEDNARDYASVYRQLLARQRQVSAMASPGSRANWQDLASRRLADHPPKPPAVETCHDLLCMRTQLSATDWGRNATVLLISDGDHCQGVDDSRDALAASGYRGDLVTLDRRQSNAEALFTLHRRLCTTSRGWCLILRAGDRPLSEMATTLAAAETGADVLLMDQVLVGRDGHRHSAVVVSDPDRLLSLSGAEPVSGLCVRGEAFEAVSPEHLTSPALSYDLLLSALCQGRSILTTGRVAVQRADYDLSPGQSDACLAAHRHIAEAYRVRFGWAGRIVDNGAGFGWRFEPQVPTARRLAIRCWGPEPAARAAAHSLRERLAGRIAEDVGVLGRDQIPADCDRAVLIHAGAEAMLPVLFSRLLAWLELDGVAMVAPRRCDMLDRPLACGWRFDGHSLCAVPDPSRTEGCSLAQVSDLPRAMPGLSNVCLGLRLQTVTARDLEDLADPDPARSFLAQQRWRRAGHLLWIPDASVRQAGAESDRIDVPPGVRRVLVMQGLDAHRPAVMKIPPVDLRTRPRRGGGARERPRIAALTRDHWAPSRYRVDLPLGDLADAGRIARPAVWRRTLEPWPSLFELAELTPAAVLFHDSLDDEAMQLQVALARHLPQTRRIAIVDDLITDLPPWHPDRDRMSADVGERLERLVRGCHLLVVTSSGLADAYGAWAREVRVIENALPERPWCRLASVETAAASGARVRVGWVGAQQHQGDLELIDAVVRARPRLDWQFFGMAPESARSLGVTCHPMVPFDDYPRRLAELGLDIALVPLAEHPFNCCKSALKLFELGALGIAVVASDIQPYRDAPVHRVCGDVDEWLDVLDDLVAQPDRRRASGAALRRWTFDAHLSRHRRESWCAALGVGDEGSGDGAHIS